MTKVKAWISAARLRTLPLSIAGIITGSAAAVEISMFSLPIFILAIATTLGFQILSNYANDYGDGVKGTDNHERVGPARAMQSGLLSEQELKRGMIVTSIITLIIACSLIYVSFGKDEFLLSLIFFVLGIAAIIAAIKYTVGNSAYGYRAMGDIFVFLFFGLLGVLGSYFLFTKEISNFIVLPAITIGLLSTAVLNLNNMRDRISDGRVHKNTVAVVLGAEKVKFYHYSLIIVAFVISIIYFFLTSENILDFLPVIAFIPLLIHLITVKKNTSPPLLDPELKKVALSTFLFSILFFVSTFF